MHLALIYIMQQHQGTWNERSISRTLRSNFPSKAEMTIQNSSALPGTYLPPPAIVAGAHVSGMTAYQKLTAEAQADYSGYWARIAREFVSWRTPFTSLLDESEAPF